MEFVPTSLAIKRGLRLRCPQCGNGKLLQGYLTAQKECNSCHMDFAPLRADDGPAWLTILITGHLMVPIMTTVMDSGIQSTTVILAILLPIMLLLCLIILPPAKGVFMAIIWATRVRKPLHDPESKEQQIPH